MKKTKNLSRRFMAVLLSCAMMLTPVGAEIQAFAEEPDAQTEHVDAASEGGEASEAVVEEAGTVDGASEETHGTAEILAVTDFSSVGGWNESIYAEIAGVADADVTEVSYSGTMNGSLTGEDLTYLVRSNGNGGVRIDIPGLKAGTYTLTVKVGGSTLTKSDITVYAYDRSGFAHFNYTDGVGAYKDDGTLKDGAIVLYVTDANKNDVTLTCNGITVKGIGNILNSVGKESSSGKASNGGAANTNQGIIKELAKAGKPLVVRFIGTVSETGLYAQGTYNAASAGLIDGLTVYSSVDNGGTAGDNGHMARIQSGKDITLEGIGYDAKIDGWGFHYIAESSDPSYGKSFEVRNLTFINTPEDAIGMEGQQASKNTSSDLTSSVERCWIHNNEFYCPHITSPAESDKAEGDGSVDFKRGQYFTCSYNYFDSCHKTNLVGSADYSLQYNLSYHHNYWYMCKARGPLTRNANVHMYNNIFDMQTDYAMNTRANAYIFSEYNLFYACKSPQAVEGGAIKSYHDSISSVIWNKGTPGTVVENKTDYVSNACQFQARNIKYDKFDTDANLSYIPGGNYALQEDFAQMRKVIVSQTGVLNQTPKLADEVTTSEYSVIKNATVNSVDSLPATLTPGKISKTTYAFEVGSTFNIEISYASNASCNGVLVNECGENLLTGSGSVVGLPAGKYMIQPEAFEPGDPAKGTIAVFKETTIDSIIITAFDPNEHYHKWVLDASQSVAATCTTAGKNVYNCTNPGCSVGTKEEPVAALGHSYSTAWTIDVPATETTPGSKSHHCTRCDAKTDVTEIPAGTTGGGDSGESGGSGGTITAAGDYVLTFDATNKKPVDSENFFTVAGNYSNSKGTAVVNGTTYSDCLKMESSTSITFSCNDGAVLFLAFASTEAGKKVKVDGTEYTTDANGTVTIDLAGGSHTISKGDSINLFYVAVSNGASSVVAVTLTFEYNYDDAPEAQTVTIASGTSYASMAELAPAGLSRSGYVLSGLYTDASCTTAITYPYVATADATLYADWTASDVPEVKTYSLIFDSNGGTLPADMEASVNAATGTKVTLGACTPAAGQKFVGWNIGNSTEIIVDSYTVNPADADQDKVITIKAVYAAEGDQTVYYTVTIDTDGGSLADGGGLERKVPANGTIDPGKCVKAGYTFKIWTIDGVAVRMPYTVTKDVALKATYTIEGAPPVYYTVTLDTDGGVLVGGGETERTVVENDTIDPGKCEKPGYTFVGWTVNGNPITVPYMVTGNVTLKAAYTEEKKTGIAIIGLEEKYDYTGAKILPNIGVIDYDVEDGRILVPGTDYTVQFKNNTKVGTAQVIVTGKGNYLGKDIQRKFEIVAVKDITENLVDLKGAKLAAISPVVYTGDAQYPKFTLTLKGGSPVEYTYNGENYVSAEGAVLAANVALSNNINKGTATILLTGSSDAKGKVSSLKKTFKITAVDLKANADKVKVETQAGVYAVKGAAPASITVSYDGKTLKKGTDYTVKYSGNKTATTAAMVTITGKGNYAKSCVATYAIAQLDLADSGLEVKAVKAYTGLKAGKVTATVVDHKGDALKASQYTLHVYKEDGTTLYNAADILTAGTIYVEAEAKDTLNIKGKTEAAAFTVGKDIAKAKAVINKVDKKTITKTYTGAPVALEAKDLTVSIKEAGVWKNLEMGKDFEIVSYSNNINKGTATAVISGIGEYSGTKTVKFKIVGKDMKIDSAASWEDSAGFIRNFIYLRIIAE